MAFKIVVWCPICGSEDGLGCFEAGTETYGPYSSVEEAEKAGQEVIENSPWEFEVYEVVE